MFKDGLPFNRKEQYFTATVLPQIICTDEFNYFGLFTDLIKLPTVTVGPDPWETVQFFTEYSLKDAAGVDRNEVLESHTPDAVIYIQGEESALICIEAKMFDSPSRTRTISQLEGQRSHVLQHLLQSLSPKYVSQVALLPNRLAQSFGDLPGVIVLTWESILEVYAPVLPNNYFMKMLRYALDHQKELAAKDERGFGANKDNDLFGSEIYDSYKCERLPYLTMGRAGGFNGPLLQEDLKTGAWRRQSYEVAKREVLANSNWFPISSFVEAIDSKGGSGSGSSIGGVAMS